MTEHYQIIKEHALDISSKLDEAFKDARRAKQHGLKKAKVKIESMKQRHNLLKQMNNAYKTDYLKDALEHQKDAIKAELKK